MVHMAQETNLGEPVKDGSSCFLFLVRSEEVNLSPTNYNGICQPKEPVLSYLNN